MPTWHLIVLDAMKVLLHQQVLVVVKSLKRRAKTLQLLELTTQTPVLVLPLLRTATVLWVKLFHCCLLVTQILSTQPMETVLSRFARVCGISRWPVSPLVLLPSFFDS